MVQALEHPGEPVGCRVVRRRRRVRVDPRQGAGQRREGVALGAARGAATEVAVDLGALVVVELPEDVGAELLAHGLVPGVAGSGGHSGTPMSSMVCRRFFSP